MALLTDDLAINVTKKSMTSGQKVLIMVGF